MSVLLIFIGSAAAANLDNMGNKYLASDFSISEGFFSASIINQKDGAAGDFYWEITTSPSANHNPANVKQSGTFSGGLGTFPVGETLSFTPENGATYYLLVFTNYPEHDNRVSKAITVFCHDPPVNT